MLQVQVRKQLLCCILFKIPSEATLKALAGWIWHAGHVFGTPVFYLFTFPMNVTMQISIQNPE